MSESNHITWHDSEVTKKQRQHKNGHKSAVIWFTGLSGSGKSTVSVALEKELFNEGKQTYRLDGDNVRHGKEDREGVRALLEDNEFIEVYTKCSVEECEKRDPKGLYKKARSGEIPEFTGISAPYQAPENPEITIDTEHDTIEQSVVQIIRYLKEHEYI
ncbi:MAG: adenylyl-sulfate kinase [Staphylococcus epidermidis]|nr:adenylyl-sulfate kinase [Staphylococcus epidermidis]